MGFCIWLFLWDKAAEPRDLNPPHRESIAECTTCHEPWKGVSEGKCGECHVFSHDVELRKGLKFHEANRYCLNCHTLHTGSGGNGSVMDHTLFSGELLCAQCHFDEHDGLFGRECRECHSITTWKIKGYRHPQADNRHCHRCHGAPSSHCEPGTWECIKLEAKGASVSRKDCWYCHTTRGW
jgi:hypothetical protein